MAQGRINGAPDETQIPSCKFVSQSWKTITLSEAPYWGVLYRFAGIT